MISYCGSKITLQELLESEKKLREEQTLLRNSKPRDGFLKMDMDSMKRMERACKDPYYDPLGFKNNGISCLFEALEKGDTETVLKYLDYGADTNVRDKQGRTLLDVALERGNKAVVARLTRK